MVDAAWCGIGLLKTRPPGRNRVLVLIGQPNDDGSDTALATLRHEAEKAYISIYTLTLPVTGHHFAPDTLTMKGRRVQRSAAASGRRSI